MHPDFVAADLWRLAAIPLLPLLAFFVQTLVGRFGPRKGDWIPTLAMFVAAALALYEAGKLFGAEEGPVQVRSGDPAYGLAFRWIPGSSGAVGAIGILYDPLSAVMTAAVAVISFLIHLFSIGYMHGDRRYASYFAHLSLFSFGMLGLVLSDNFLSFFICWEVMGLCSYLLIGHFNEKPSAAAASKKAFLTTRLGDVALFLGIAILWTKFRTFDFVELYGAVRADVAAAGGAWSADLVLAGLLLFGGAVGKSAQFPLHVWLPDAMEGPTPVSAMIHAATMVAAGVYLTGRSVPFLSPEVLLTVAVVGSFTAIFAASIGICQTDIKKVLAYSTISQLGFMIAAIGAGGVAAGLFHMVTHAAFKACLFLGSGSVIHAVHGQEMPEMGGLRRKLPVTYATMLVSTLAIAGVPLFSGFYSKDAILAAALAFGMEGGDWIRALPAVFLFAAAGMTAFYMFRLILLTFHGSFRGEYLRYGHAHESPPVMTIPLVVLGTLAVFGGSIWILNGDVLGHHPWFFTRVAPGLAGYVEPTGALHERAHGLAMKLSVGIGGLGILLAFAFYQWKVLSAEAWARRWGPVYRWVKNKYFVDEFYEGTIVGATVGASRGMRAFDQWIVDGLVNLCGRIGRLLALFAGAWDRIVVDGLVNLLGQVTQGFGAAARLFQTGRVQQYVAFAVAGTVLVAAVALLS